MSRKKTLEKKLEQTLSGQNAWVEPMRKWIAKVVSIYKIAESDNLVAKKYVLAEIFGSNLFLKNKKVVINDDKFLSPPLKTNEQLCGLPWLRLLRGAEFRLWSDFTTKLEPFFEDRGVAQPRRLARCPARNPAFDSFFEFPPPYFSF